jgi:hypothetical protein
MALDGVSHSYYSNVVSGFTKLFSSLIFSTVWREDMHVKVVWITMLAMANRNGDVLASLPGLADAARVSLDQCQDALAKLSGPDPYSRTKEHEGRRVEEIDGGWHLLNYIKYRELRDADERRIQTREAVRRHRAKQGDSITVSDVSPGKPKQKQKQKHTEETTVGADAPNREASWVDEAHTLYADAIGLVPHGRLGKALKPAVDAHGWPQVKRWFTAYCTTRPYQKRDGSFHGDRPGDKPEDAVKDTRFCSPEDFAGNLATWRERCSPMVSR